MTVAWTLEDARRVRDELRARPIDDAPIREEMFHDAAALLTWFIFDPDLHRGAAGNNLRQDCVNASRTDPSRLALKDSVRRRVLGRLRTREALHEALRATSARPGDAVQRMLEAWLDDTAPPLNQQTPEELAATLQVADWFADTEMASSLPPAGDIRTRIEYESLLSPLRELAGSHFRGRVTELAVLQSYLQASDAANIGLRPPLLICGPGGMGKSALIAKFILNNLSNFLVAYLDCDRPGLVAAEPVTLLAEVVRQIGLQFPDFRLPAEEFRARWLAQIARAYESGGGPQQMATLGRKAMMDEFHAIVSNLRLDDRKMLMVLDTFEEIQFRSQAVVSEVFQFLEELQVLLPNLRSIVAGRNPVPGFVSELLEIGELDQETAQAVLEVLGIASPVRELLNRLLHGNPLSLRMAAELYRLGEGPGIDELQAVAGDAELQGLLYGRILDHVHDDDVRQIAHPGLILRRITSDIIRQVLAGPCGLQAVDGPRAEHLFGLLRDELSLVVPEGDAVRHRADVRRVMLRPLKRAQPDTVRRIEEAAIRYYLPFKVPAARAEEIYHRLSLMQPVSDVEERWLPGIEDALQPAIDELEGASRVYLAARLGIELYDVDWDIADQASWELFAERQAKALLGLDKPLEAIRLLRRRSERLPGSPLHWLHAQSLRRSGQNLEAREVARQGIARLLGDPRWERDDEQGADEASPSLHTMAWFAGPDLGAPPTVGEAKKQFEWNCLLRPLRTLATQSFAGRAQELAALDSYVRSATAALRETRPPLLIHGPAGAGKSALLARFVLANLKRLPLVYIDCASLNLSPAAGSPSFAVVSEIARQLSLQFPGFDDIGRRDEATLHRALAGVPLLAPDWGGLLFVVDGIDELAFRSSLGVHDIYALLSRLRAVAPRLRPVVVARGSMEDFAWERLEIGRLDAEAAHAFLAAEGIASSAARDNILRLTNGHPFAMKVAADLVRRTGEEVLAEDDFGEAFGQGDSGAEILLRRIVEHVPDPELRRIIYPAVVVRRITVDILRYVIAEPAGVTIDSDARAKEIFAALSNEMGLFNRGEPGVLSPRVDVRRLLLRMQPYGSAQAAIHERAVAYYQERDGIADRAEEVYHRLALRQPVDEIDSRWREGIEPLIRQAVEEIYGPARAYLAAKLGIELDDRDWLLADQATWEAYVATRAADLLLRNEPREVLGLLRQRSTRLQRSNLPAIEVEALLATGQPREAFTVVTQALDLWPESEKLTALLAKCDAALGAEEAALAPSGRVVNLHFERGLLLFDREVLRRFLYGLGQGGTRNRVLLVNGGPGSGKSMTIRAAQALLGERMRIGIVEVDEASTAHSVIEALYYAFDWRWEPPQRDEATPWDRAIERYAQMIKARAQQDPTPTLVIFHNRGAPRPREVGELVQRLTERPGELTIIAIGFDASLLSPLALPHSVIEELHDFTPIDIEEGIRRFTREMNLSPGRLKLAVDTILSAVEPGGEYNKKVGALAQSIIATYLAGSTTEGERT